MKFNTKIKEAIDAQIPMADYIPHSVHVRPHIIKNKRGEYVGIWRLEGISFETLDEEEITIRKEGLSNLLRAMGGGHFALWSHRIRRVVKERLNGHYENEFCKELNDRYYQSFETYKQMATELYLSIVYRPTPSKVASFFKSTKKRVEDIASEEQVHLDIFDDMSKQFEASLARYTPIPLSTFEKENIVYSEMLSFLGFLSNGVWEDIPMRRSEIAEYLPTSRLHFGDKNGMLEIWHPQQNKFVGFLDVQEYPKFSEPGMNNVILYGDYEYIETQSFSILNKRDAIEAIERQKGQLEASEEASVTEIKEMSSAIDWVQNGHIEIGEYHYSLAIFGETLNRVAKNMADARSALQESAGFKMSVIDVVPECAWFAQLPGNWSMRPREAKITSRNFACLNALHNFPKGKRHGNPWGEALTLVKTPSGQPHYLNFHVSPINENSIDQKYPGNTFICGSTGVGKTALLMFLLAQATKYNGLRCVFFDKDRGAEIGIRAMGGKYQALTRGESTGFNPFQLEPTENNIQFCEKLVRQLVKQSATPLTAREESDISQAVRTVMSEKVSFELRRLTTVAQSLPVTGENSLKARLKKWTAGQALGWVFDNPLDTQDFTGANLFGYDYTEFLDDPEIRTPIMAYLLHITENLINGKPFIYFMEEFWKPLTDEMFSDFVFNKQKTIRKQFGLGVFVTQSPSDVLTHRIGKTMVEQSVTQIYLPNPRADFNDYVHGFKVTQAEFEIIRNLGESSRLALVKQGQQSTIIKLDLGSMPDLLNVISGTTDNVVILDAIRAEVGDDPKTWLPILHERVAKRKKSNH